MQRTKILILILFILTTCAKIKLSKKIYLSNTSPNWQMYGGDPARTNVYQGDISLPLKLAWKHSASAAIGKTILVVDGVVFFNTMDGRTYALNIKTGEKIGNKKTEIHATSVVSDSILFIARRYGDNTLFKYNLNNARTEWKINAGDISSEPLVLDSGIVVTALYKHIDLYDLTNGERIWQTETNDQIRSSPACDGETIFFGCDNGCIYAVNKSDGEIQWEFKTEESVEATPSIKNGTLYIGSTDKYFYAIDIKTGKLQWQFETNGQIFHTSAVNDSVVVFGSTDSRLYCLNRMTGELIWQFEAESVISTSPLICKNHVFFGSLDHNYYGLNISNGAEQWKFKAKGRIRTAPVIWGNYLICASENNYIYAFTSIKGN